MNLCDGVGHRVLIAQPILNPRLLGLHGQLSTIALPLAAGRTYTVFVGSEEVDQISENGITVTSPLITVNPASLMRHEFGAEFAFISFEVTVSASAVPGEYSIRLQSKSGEVAYLAGGLTIKEMRE